MQAQEVVPKILDLLVSPATSIAAIYFYDRFIARRRPNGTSSKELLQHFDLTITEHFDQLRRDLETKIEKATENSMMKYYWQLEERRKESR